MSGLRKLNMMDFTTLIPVREKKIESSPEEKLPELNAYKANRLAAALHPKSQKLIVSDVQILNDSAKLFTLCPDKEAGTEQLAYFSAGQYLCFTLKIGSAYTTRPYTICSSPKDALNGRYQILVKKVSDGFVSEYILNNWEKGTKVVSSGPLGNFTYEPLRDAKTVIGIAGGSGISVFYSLAKAVKEGTEDFSLTVLYGSKTEKDILLKNELEELASGCEKIKIVNVLSDEKKDGFENGFIGADLIKKYAGTDSYSVFVCGPKAMYDFLEKEIPALNIRRKFVRFELSGVSKHAKDYKAFPCVKEGTYKLTVICAGKTVTAECASEYTLLSALERNGIPAPARCRSGICGWCRSRLLSGEVFIPEESDGRRFADAQFGYIHPCATFPLGDITLEIPPVN